MAKLLARTPPTASATIKTKQRILAMMSFFRANLSMEFPSRSGEWQWVQEFPNDPLIRMDCILPSSSLQHTSASLPWAQYLSDACFPDSEMMVSMRGFLGPSLPIGYDLCQHLQVILILVGKRPGADAGRILTKRWPRLE